MSELFEYGIMTEQSDIRAHVSVVHQTIYVFQTQAGRDAIITYKPPLRTSTQPGANGITATGWPVELAWIKDLRQIHFPDWKWWNHLNANGGLMLPDRKGAAAVQCVIAAMKLGRFPFWVDASEDDRLNVQIKGQDIVVFCRKKVQVKCDWRSGPKPLGTGNLYLQKAERNPFKLH